MRCGIGGSKMIMGTGLTWKKKYPLGYRAALNLSIHKPTAALEQSTWQSYSSDRLLHEVVL
jgi:hypothetical protein